MRIVLFGATGYTGRLTAHALSRRGCKPMLAGRDQRRLDLLADELPGGSEVLVADATDDAAVRNLVGPDDVILTTVGPFSRFGLPLAKAAAAAGATYLDSTGEPAFVKALVDRVDPWAQRTGATLVPAFGYDYVPGNLAAELALLEAPDATRVRVGYFVTGRGGPSGGTLASGAGMMIDPAYAWRGGRLVPDRMASRHATFDMGGRPFQGVSLAGSEHLWLPRRHPGVTDVEVYLGWFAKFSRAAQGLSAAMRVMTAVPPGQDIAHAVVRRVLPGSSGGPDEQARSLSRTRVVAETAEPGRGRLSRVVLDGPNHYDLTAELLAWAAEKAQDRPPRRAGVVGPAGLFGLDELVTGAASIGLAPLA